MSKRGEDSDFPQIVIAERDGKFVVTTAELELTETSFVLCRAWQEGLDVEVEVWEIDGDKIQGADSPSGPFGMEELAVVLPPGRYRVDVISKKPPGNNARVEVEGPEVRPLGEHEQHWAQAADWVLEGRAAVKAKEYSKAMGPLQKGAELAGKEGLLYWQAYAGEQLALALRKTGDSPQALIRYEEAVSWFSLLPGGERREANNRQNAAVLLLETGRIDEAIQHLEAAWPTFERQAHQRGMALALLRLGRANLAKGRFQVALDHLHRAESPLKHLDSSRLNNQLKLEMGWALLAVARPQEALDAFLEAKEMADASGRDGDILVAASGIASAALQMGRLDRAAEAIDEALAMNPPAGTTRVGLLLARGNLNRQRGLESEAKESFMDARALAESLDDPKALANALLSLGHIEIQTGRPDKALNLLDQAQEIFKGAGHLSGLASSRARRAEALRSLGRLEEAWTSLERALEDVEALRRSSGRRDHRLGFFASFRQDYFVMARDILLDLGDTSRAFQVDESRRARELLDSLRYKGHSSPELRRLGEEESRLERELRSIVATGGPKASPEALRPLMDELHRLSADRNRQQREQAAVEMLDLSELKGDLDPSTALLVYSLGEPKSLVWIVTRDHLEVFHIDSGQDIQAAVRSFRGGILNLSRQGRVSSTARAKRLSDMLLAPVPQLGKFSRWVVVGESEIQQLPFAALPIPGSDIPVIENHELVYFPSVTSLMELRSRGSSRAARPRIAAFVDPVFGSEDARITGSAPHQLSMETVRSDEGVSSAQPIGPVLERLPRSTEEGRYLLSLQPDDRHLLVSGFSANRTSFEQLDGSELDLLHLATHALVHDRPEMSSLVFSRLDEKGETVDGLVTAIEISRRNLPLDLVVLSACETGLGRSIRGEGTLSLAWSFLDAGSERVVSSLWGVDDRFTAELMKIFYTEQLVNGLAPAAALRRAQLEMKAKANASFYSWAGFILQGNWS